MLLFLIWGLVYVVQGKTICEVGRFHLNGVCVQQFNFCPLNSIFLNGICFPTSLANCTKGQISVNNECCSEACLVSCEQTVNCPCCGKVITYPAQALPCNFSQILPPCNAPLLPCIAREVRPTAPPKPLVCPPGTVMTKGQCLLVHCSNGVYMDGRCIRLQCPSGTFWQQGKCVPDESHNYYISYNHSHNMEVTNDDSHLNKQPAADWEEIMAEDMNELENVEDFSTTTETPLGWEDIYKEDAANLAQNGPCCYIVSPRICKLNEVTKAWNCFNRKHAHCGSICEAETICLLPAKSRQCRDFIIVVPPPKNFNQTQLSNGTIDCSGCVLGDYTRCHGYCYHYGACSDLSPIDCQVRNEEEFCANNTGLEGCLKADALYDSIPYFA